MSFLQNPFKSAMRPFFFNRFFKSLMARKKRNEKFKKDFLKKTGVDLNQIDPGGNAKPRV